MRGEVHVNFNCLPWPPRCSQFGFEAKTRLNRKDFGLKWNKVLEAGGTVVGDDQLLEKLSKTDANGKFKKKADKLSFNFPIVFKINELVSGA